MKPRNLSGMIVTEFRANTQAELLHKIARFVEKKHCSVSSVALDCLTDMDEQDAAEIATVVWA